MEEDTQLRKKIFVDTNVVISGTFFEGNESKLLSLEDVVLHTSDVVVKELIRKEKSLENFEGIISNLFLLEREV